MSRKFKASEVIRQARVKRISAMARTELRQESTPRTPSAGPTSFAIKQTDPNIDRMVREFLERRR